MKILVTGCAGFIGAHIVKRLTADGHSVTGIDNLNSYYDPDLKKARLDWIRHPDFHFTEMNLEDKKALPRLFDRLKPQVVINMAAQAGVRYSLEAPHAYIRSNVDGFTNLLECCRMQKPEHLIYASTSSVYGANKQIPFSTDDRTDHPISLYAATKKANELLAWTYSHLYDIPASGLRFFTVYGPWGRPDMALFTFTKRILEGKPIDVYNYGNMKRDFTYVDDIVESIVRLIPEAPERNDKTGEPPYALYNIGSHSPVNLLDMISLLEEKLGEKAIKRSLPLQPGDMVETYADVTPLMKKTGFKPSVPLKEGISRFVDWYRDFYSV
ncbi:NAD-dependent epimerase/dehydratase family protein [Alteribacter natronophilus]|uniref:NAD-dependent epimerase/dehydratase family protein n=1 Tax=Alteribacter natronophilus TaxID=2583810 RepID=UPI00110E4471|nr:NAD-dependent epimerase/dehydratase family protein [Alteribacter natronophilus]TMW71843.1 NAD-dependent epimerase/dehydratase family protein [Alteribacter natronophilus]